MESADMSAVSEIRFLRHQVSRQDTADRRTRLDEPPPCKHALCSTARTDNDTLIGTKSDHWLGILILACSSAVSMASIFAIARLFF